jgi:2-oxoglutarate dehydrogenase E2 component (dihydrolipoamide succinyltransferase)
MPVELIVPSVGESITEVEIGDWLKKQGEVVMEDEPVVIIETEKVSVELPAPTTGTITKLVKQTGEKASVGDVIGYMEPNGSASPTGRGRRDSRQADASGEPRSTPTTSPDPVSTTTPVSEDVPSPASTGREEQVVPMTPIRKRIAERLVEAKNNAALLTTFNQVDMSAVKDLRSHVQETFQSKYGIKLGLMSFFVKASVEALKLVPQINAEIRGTDIVYRKYYDIGIAVGGGKGLVVPILRNAENMSFAQIERTIADFAQRAQNNQLKVDELQGGTFTISNGGIYGSMLSTPIVNPPQSGVLGLHAIEDRPVAVNGQVVIRPMMYVALTYDHRIVDGREAVLFLKRIKEDIEEPSRLLLEI